LALPPEERRFIIVGFVISRVVAVGVILGAGWGLGVVEGSLVIFVRALAGFVVNFVVVIFVVVVFAVVRYQNTPTVGGTLGFCSVVQKLAFLSEKNHVAEWLVSGEAFIALLDV
jgi:hypothetical protein